MTTGRPKNKMMGSNVMFSMKALALAFLLLGQGLPQTQDEEDTHVYKVEVKLSKSEARPGEVITAKVELYLDPGWHIYSVREKNRTATALSFQGPVELWGPIQEPSLREYDVYGEKKKVHVKEAVFEMPLLVKKGTPPGKAKIDGNAKIYICSQGDNGQCLDRNRKFSFELTVLEGEVAPPAKPKEDPADASGESDLLSGGFLAFLLLCVGGGLISLVMPCVYPLIPITITYFVKQSEGQKRAIGMSSMYALGIIVSFTGLGVILSAVLGAGGAQKFASNPWVNLVVATMFVVFALSLFGLFELRLPSFITNLAGGGGARKGAGGAFVLGCTFSVVTFTCTIPIAASLMAMAAGGKWFWAATGMLVYSMTMATPFFLLGFSPALLAKVPRSGGWLQTVKICAAFLETALAVKYFANSDFSFGFQFIGRDFGILVWVSCMAFAAFYLLGLFRLKDEEPVQHLGLFRMFVAMIFLGSAVFFFSGLHGRNLGAAEMLLPYHKFDDSYDDYDKALQAAKDQNKPLFIEFTGFS